MNKNPITLTILDNGNLEIKRNISRKDFKELYLDKKRKDYIRPEWGNILDESRYLGNGWEDLKGHLGLTDSPIIGHDVIRDDDEHIIEADKVWWFPEYMIIDELEELLKNKKVVFRMA